MIKNMRDSPSRDIHQWAIHAKKECDALLDRSKELKVYISQDLHKYEEMKTGGGSRVLVNLAGKANAMIDMITTPLAKVIVKSYISIVICHDYLPNTSETTQIMNMVKDKVKDIFSNSRAVEQI